MMPYAINALVDVTFLAIGSLGAQTNTGNILGAAVFHYLQIRKS
jgi:hypothetical protein